MEEQYQLIKFEGMDINLFFAEGNPHINLNDILKAANSKKSILNWMRSRQTLEFLSSWEKRNNPNFKPVDFDTFGKKGKANLFRMTPKQWAELTNAIGISSKSGNLGGTYAHRYIAQRFAAWVDSDFELALTEKLDELLKVEQKVNSHELVSHDQVIYLLELIQVFKYVVNQEAIEKAHKEIYAANTKSKSPFAEYNDWRNEVLKLEPKKVDERLIAYCNEKNIAATKEMLNRPKKNKLLFYDKPQTVINAVWDFLKVANNGNVDTLLSLVDRMVRATTIEVYHENKDDLFRGKEDLKEFNNFHITILDNPKLIAAQKQLNIKPRKIKQLN